MHKIDGAGHNNGQFTNEDLSTSQPGTEVTADWLNAVQNELVNVIQNGGITLNKSVNNQLYLAIQTLISGSGISFAPGWITGIQQSVTIGASQVNRGFEIQQPGTNVTLPTVASVANGSVCFFKCNHDVTLITESDKYIFTTQGSAPSMTFRSGSTIMLVSNGNGWYAMMQNRVTPEPIVGWQKKTQILAPSQVLENSLSFTTPREGHLDLTGFLNLANIASLGVRNEIMINGAVVDLEETLIGSALKARIVLAGSTAVTVKQRVTNTDASNSTPALGMVLDYSYVSL